MEKYDLNILRKTIKSTSVPEPFRMRFEIGGPVALILVYYCVYKALNRSRWIPDLSIRGRRGEGVEQDRTWIPAHGIRE